MAEHSFRKGEAQVRFRAAGSNLGLAFVRYINELEFEYTVEELSRRGLIKTVPGFERAHFGCEDDCAPD